MRWQNGNGPIVTTEQLLAAYSNLDPTNHSDCDNLLHDFGPGNRESTTDPLMHIIDRPYERLAIYEHIMHELYVADPVKYERMHKGTLYFFTSWLAFSVKDFEKAIFYMDSATSEDIRATSITVAPDSWQTTPAARFLFLDPSQQGMAARAIMGKISTEFQRLLNSFNSIYSANITIVNYRDRFVLPNIQNNSFRSIISGLYVFIMEYAERTYMIRLKSNHGGSIEPFLTHLFKGCLIFESLLKTEYSSNGTTLGKYLSHPQALVAFELRQNAYSASTLYRRDQPSSGYTLPTVIGLLPTWRSEDPKERIIAITYGIRNTAGHDLSWPVTFDESVYQEIYEAILYSIFWFIWKVKL